MATHAPGSSTATTSIVRNSTPFASDFHTPVLCSEVLEWLLIDPEGVYLDCTLGGGGHSEAILSSLKPGGRLVALDQDPDALAFASKRLERFIAEGRFRPLRSNFRDAAATLQANDAIPQDKFTGKRGGGEGRGESREGGRRAEREGMLSHWGCAASHRACLYVTCSWSSMAGILLDLGVSSHQLDEAARVRACWPTTPPRMHTVRPVLLPLY